ncbi:MAG TPA: GNAT family N-acetyltransferase [Caulobacteraceae bacterium]|nr:GNAT family N-acetyltransferase [Caulobacteraceae bacterium]
MEIDVLRPQFMPAEMVEHWRALQAASPHLDSPFLSPHWPRVVERAQQGLDRGLRVALLHEGGRPRGFLAVRGEGGAAMAPGAPLCGYQGLIAEAGVTLDPRRLVQALNVGRLDFSCMLEGMDVFDPYARGRTVSHVVDIGRSYSEYAAGVTVLEALEEAGAKAESEAGAAHFSAYSKVGADFDRLFAWKREAARDSGETDIFAAEWTGRLMRELFESRDPDFGGILFTLHIGDRLAAAHFHLRGRSTIHAWMGAHNPGLARYEPEKLLTHAILKWMDDTPFRRLDLGPGDDPFRDALANRAQTTLQGFVGVPSPAAFVRGAEYGLRRAAESLKLGKVSQMPARAMEKRDLLRGLK